MKKLFILVGLLLAFQAHAQKFFRFVPAADGQVAYPEDRMPSDYRLMKVDKQALINLLTASPDQFSGRRSDILLTVPLPDNDKVTFRMYRTHPMSAEREAEFPGMLSFRGVEVKGARRMRMEINSLGVFLKTYGGRKGGAVLQPYDNAGTYIYYFMADQPGLEHHCDVTESIEYDLPGQSARPAYSDQILRTFRLAFAADGEFSQFHVQQAINNGTLPSNATDAQKKQAVLAAINVIIDRVNEVYETDFAIHLQLISGTNIIYLDPNSDPYSNNNGSQLLSQNQNNLDNVIGSSNYDIGHVGTTGGGGLAGLGVVCRNGMKARGETGLPAPVGDEYAIDFVAHEMGHQFGANHTFANYCGGNRNDATAVEPGSGTTIMAYAGVCSPNVQDDSDPQFHYVSMDEIMTYLSSLDCLNPTNISNNPPTASFGADKYIPKDTPFMLEITASDADGDALTYTWDEVDVYNDSGQTNAAPQSDNTTGPMFRVYPVSSSNVRYFPRMSDILNGNYGNTWEVLPTVERLLTFRGVVRDNNAAGGQTADDIIYLGVKTNAGPFRVTSHTSDIHLHAGDAINITWNVAGTDAGQVDTPNVDILLSLDGGQTFTVPLATNVPNDGSETVTIPSGADTPNGHYMVKGHDNYFFDVNKGNIMIGDYQTICSDYNNNSSVSIPDNDPNGITSTIQVSDSYSISDLNVSVNISHTYIQDLKIKLTSPTGTQVTLFNQNCSSQDNIVVTFDDDGASMDCGQMAAGNTYHPVGNLSDFNGENVNGTWTLFVSDNYNGDTGTLNSWSIHPCRTEHVNVSQVPVDALRIYPNPASRSVSIDYNASTSHQNISVTDLNGRLIYQTNPDQTGAISRRINVSQWARGVYLLRITDGDRMSVRKLVVE